MSLTQMLAVLRARWRWMALVFCTLLGGAMAAAQLATPRYAASASLVFDFRPDPVAALAPGGLSPAAALATQADVLRSERVARRVIALLGLEKHSALRQRWQAETDGHIAMDRWLLELLAESLHVQTAREGGVVTVRVVAEDAQLAAAIANGFVQAYIDTSLELRVAPARQLGSFFGQQAQAARERLEQAQARLAAFRAAKGIVVADERLDIENARLAELSSQLTVLQSRAAESASRKAMAEGERADRLQELIANPLLSQLKADVARADSHLQQLTTRLGQNHPQVVEATTTLAELRRRLDSESARVAGSVGVTNTIDRQREGELRAALAAQRSRLLALKGDRDEAAELQREVEAAQRAHDTLVQRLAQSSLESQATHGQASLLSPALAPLEPTSPGVRQTLALGALLGLLVALGSALLLELRDRRVRSALDLHTELGLPVLAVFDLPRKPVPLAAPSGAGA
jgi:polysaccharide biosynthesis transport protein